jgi:hypothetical protein
MPCTSVTFTPAPSEVDSLRELFTRERAALADSAEPYDRRLGHDLAQALDALGASPPERVTLPVDYLRDALIHGGIEGFGVTDASQARPGHANVPLTRAACVIGVLRRVDDQLDVSSC